MAGRLTTHVLDTAHGRPAADLALRLRSEDGELLADARTNADGRLDAPLLEGERMVVGHYAIEFHVADYFRSFGVPMEDPPFIDVVTVRFGVAKADRPLHVPLLVSPYGYSTYRGS